MVICSTGHDCGHMGPVMDIDGVKNGWKKLVSLHTKPDMRQMSMGCMSNDCGSIHACIFMRVRIGVGVFSKLKIGTSSRWCSRSPLGGRLATMLLANIHLIYSPNNFLVGKKNLVQEKNLIRKKILIQKNCWSKKIFGPKKLVGKKNDVNKHKICAEVAWVEHRQAYLKVFNISKTFLTFFFII